MCFQCCSRCLEPLCRSEGKLDGLAVYFTLTGPAPSSLFAAVGGLHVGIMMPTFAGLGILSHHCQLESKTMGDKPMTAFETISAHRDVCEKLIVSMETAVSKPKV